MNCPLLALSITGRPASIFSASHCWLLLNCASPRQRVGDAVGGVDIGHKQEALARVFKPQQAGGALADHRGGSVGQGGEQRRQRGARLEAGYSQQNQIVVGGNGDFGEDGIFFSARSAAPSRRLRRSIHAKPPSRRNTRRLLHILPLASQWAASRCWASVR